MIFPKRNILQHPVLTSICPCPLIDDLMPCIFMFLAKFLYWAIFNTYGSLSFLDGQSPPCFNTCSSLIQMTLLSSFLKKSGQMRFFRLEKRFSVLQRDLLLVWGLAVVPVETGIRDLQIFLSPIKEAQENVPKFRIASKTKLSTECVYS